MAETDYLKRVEVEVVRIGGPDIVDGELFPRWFGPVVIASGGEGWQHKAQVRAGEGPWSVEVELSPMRPGRQAGWLYGEMRLVAQNGVWLGTPQPYQLWTEPSAVAVQTTIGVTLVYDGRPIHVGVFVVALRVPYDNEHRPPLLPGPTMPMLGAAGS